MERRKRTNEIESPNELHRLVKQRTAIRPDRRSHAALTPPAKRYEAQHIIGDVFARVANLYAFGFASGVTGELVEVLSSAPFTSIDAPLSDLFSVEASWGKEGVDGASEFFSSSSVKFIWF